jgi:serine/threonine-protein kinase
MNGTAPSPYPNPGEVIDGKYRIDRMLGEGGMGAVMGAYHLFLKAPVALKFISPDMLRVPGAVERFLNEGVAARGIHSDHVVRIDDVGKLPSGLPFIVMEMMSGCDLSELLERDGQGGGLEVARSAHFVLQILRGLSVAHAGGVIHRDLKPSNAFVISKDGEEDFVKLLDFGISKISQTDGQDKQNLTQTNTGLGTPLYMSPEQARNARDATARSDLYSLSAILYELLTGRTPYVAESPNDLLYKLFTTEPDPILSIRPDLPSGLAALIHQGLSKDPAQRPGSAFEYAELLAPYADARSTDVINRLRAAAGGVPASAMLGRGSQLPPEPSRSLDRTMLASGAGSPAVARTAVPAGNGATQLDMSQSSHSTLPPRVIGAGAKIALGIGLATILVGGSVLAVKGNGEQSTSGQGMVGSAVTAPSASAPPSATVPVVVPVSVSAVPSATGAAGAAGAAGATGTTGHGGARTGPAKPPVGKSNPFNVGIVQ